MRYAERRSRRAFLQTVGRGALGALAGMALAPSAKARASVGANDTIRVALVGCGGMGNRHLDSLIARKDCEVVAVCDVFTPRYVDAVKKVTKDGKRKKCDGYQDYRRIMDRKDIDAVFCATPDHWHALVGIQGCQSWKDVYIEKPLTTTIVEGRALVNAARRYERVVQVGTQQRSLSLFQRAMEIVRGGKLGPVISAGAWIGVNGILPREEHKPVPDGLDWDLWLGPAPWVPYSPQRQYGFRAFHDYANGELTNWGPHLIDIVQWGIGQDRPLNVQAVGGSFRALSGSDDYESMEILYEYPGCTVTWEQVPHNTFADKGYGMKFHGTAGRMFMDRSSFVVEPAPLGIPETKQDNYDFVDINTHHDNFIECLRTRKLPNSDVEIGHRATSTCSLGAIALDCRRKLNWDGDAEKFIGDEDANRHLFRPYRAPWHL